MSVSHKLQLSEEDMKKFGYQIIDTIVNHFNTEHKKKPVKIRSFL